MHKKILYAQDYLDTEDAEDIILRKYAENTDIGLSPEAEANLWKFMIDQHKKDLEPIEDELSEECEVFILKCKYLSKLHVHNIEISQTSREVIADFRVNQADFHDFDELYKLAHKIEFNPYNERLCSIQFIYKLH